MYYSSEEIKDTITITSLLLNLALFAGLCAVLAAWELML